MKNRCVYIFAGEYCLFLVLFFLPHTSTAQRLSLGFEYQFYYSHDFFKNNPYKGNLTEKEYQFNKIIYSKITEKGDTNRYSYGSSRPCLASGIIIGLHRKNWNFQTGTSGSIETLSLGFKRLDNGVAQDTFGASIQKIALKIPCRLQYNLIPVFKKSAYIFIELGFNYILFEKMIRNNFTLIRNKDEEAFADEELTSDINQLINFQHQRTEFVIGVGFKFKNGRQIILRNQFYSHQLNGKVVAFHFIGISTIGDIVKGRLLRKRYKVYE
jgi:hypothetical protein